MDILHSIEDIANNPQPWKAACLLLLAALIYVYRELRAAEKARIDDAKAQLQLALQLKSEDTETKQRMESLLDEFERRS